MYVCVRACACEEMRNVDDEGTKDVLLWEPSTVVVIIIIFNSTLMHSRQEVLKRLNWFHDEA